MKTILEWLKARAKERSTWVGIITILAAAGVTLSPEQQEAIIAAGTALIGAIFAFTADKPAADASKPQWEQPK